MNLPKVLIINIINIRRARFTVWILINNVLAHDGLLKKSFNNA